jgi:hypothetical protein
MELILGVLAIWGMGIMGTTQTFFPESKVPGTLCHDLAALHTYPHADIPEIIQTFYADMPMETSAFPFHAQKEKALTCTSMRLEKGNIYPLFIRIQYE